MVETNCRSTDFLEPSVTDYLTSWAPSHENISSKTLECLVRRLAAARSRGENKAEFPSGSRAGCRMQGLILFASSNRMCPKRLPDGVR